ncbi:MAG TPA: hypothetical protein VGD02_07585 [Gemmatimonadaceae bacterium]
MRLSTEVKAALSASVLALLASVPARGQNVTASADRTTCAALLSDNTPAATAIRSDSTARADTTTRTRSDSASFGIGGARNGAADVILRVGVQIDQLRFNRQPNVRVRLCWGGDTLRVVSRQNLPSPVVAGTTYRNVYIAVELLGRVNAQCLADQIGVGNAASSRRAATSVAGCAFLGGSAGAGAQTPRQQSP